MKKLSLLIFISFFLLQWPSFAEAMSLQAAFEQRKSDVQVQGSGTVIRLLRDDNKGSRHQKFILKLSTGHTILIAHNIDLAPRINTIEKGVWFIGLITIPMGVILVVG